MLWFKPNPLLLFGVCSFLSFSLFVIGMIYCGWITVLQGGILAMSS